MVSKERPVYPPGVYLSVFDSLSVREATLRGTKIKICPIRYFLSTSRYWALQIAKRGRGSRSNEHKGPALRELLELWRSAGNVSRVGRMGKAQLLLVKYVSLVGRKL